MDDIQTAWVAGIIEGEGSIFTSGTNGATVYLTVNMTDRDVVERLREVSGVGTVTRVSFAKKNPKWLDQYRWQVGKREDVRALLQAIYPHMGIRRRAKIDSFQEHLESPDARFSDIVHGTYAGSKRCRPMCESCRTANNAYQREKYQQKHGGRSNGPQKKPNRLKST